MDIRDAQKNDVAAIADVHVSTWRAVYRGLMPDSVLASLDVDERRRTWERILTLPHSDVLVAGFPIIGFCGLSEPRSSRERASTKEGEITAIYVLSEFWGRGVGRGLMQATLGRARQRGYRTARLWVLRDNARARHFYESVGFSPEAVERVDTSLTGTPLPEVRYAIALA